MNNEKKAASTEISMDDPESIYTDEKLVRMAIERATIGPIPNLPAYFQECNLCETEPKDIFQESEEKGVVYVFTKLTNTKAHPLKSNKEIIIDREVGDQVRRNVYDKSGTVIGWSTSFKYVPSDSSKVTQKELYRMTKYTPDLTGLHANFPEYVLCKIEKQLKPNENDDTTLGASNSDSQGWKFPLPSTDTQPESTSKSLEDQRLVPTDIQEGQTEKPKKRKSEEEDDDDDDDDDDEYTNPNQKFKFLDDLGDIPKGQTEKPKKRKYTKTRSTGEEEDDDEYSTEEEEDDDEYTGEEEDDDDEYTGKQKLKGKAKKNKSHGRGRGRGRRSDRGGGQPPSSTQPFGLP